jgi:hypothetical protein
MVEVRGMSESGLATAFVQEMEGAKAATFVSERLLFEEPGLFAFPFLSYMRDILCGRSGRASWSLSIVRRHVRSVEQCDSNECRSEMI